VSESPRRIIDKVLCCDQSRLWRDVHVVWLGNQYAGDQPFHGRSTDRHVIHIPMQQLIACERAAATSNDAGTLPLTIERDGDAGRLYYRIGLKYAPTNLQVPARDCGFVVCQVSPNQTMQYHCT
jgi:hypothetical protein